LDEDAFWELIAISRAKTTPRLSDQPEMLQAELERLAPALIVAFDSIFWRLHRDAYRWDLWGAAYVIGGGCSDDAFMDFRAALIGLGRKAYYAAIADPESLADQPARGVDYFQEGLLGSAMHAYLKVTGHDLPERAGIPVPPERPGGRRWEEDELPLLYPRLTAKHDR
jgi:hypothetical protein